MSATFVRASINLKVISFEIVLQQSLHWGIKVAVILFWMLLTAHIFMIKLQSQKPQLALLAHSQQLQHRIAALNGSGLNS